MSIIGVVGSTDGTADVRLDEGRRVKLHHGSGARSPQQHRRGGHGHHGGGVAGVGVSKPVVMCLLVMSRLGREMVRRE